MNQLFRKLPLPFKLALIGLVPLIVLTYLSFQLYKENTQKVDLLGSYIKQMEQSADITKLIYNLQRERRYSFDYTLKKDSLNELKQQRPKTDSILKRLSNYESSLSDFSDYTFLKDLGTIRTAIDSGYVTVTIVMDYYTNVLFRFNTLNALPTGSDVYLKPVYKDLVAQKLLSEMVTYLGIMSANIYNALYTRQYMIEILMGTRGIYQFFKSYEKEFLLKASPVVAQSYKKVKSASSLQPVSDYLDTIFKKFSYDSTFDYAQWRNTSSAAIDEVRSLQQSLLQNALDRVSIIYKNEKSAGSNMLIFLVLALLLVITIVAYTIRIITKMLTELKYAAQKISRGESVPSFNIPSRDVIGSLAHSVTKIDNNARMLAEAADAIGNGDFNVMVKRRSDQDLLGNAIEKMKNNLQHLISDLRNAQEEIDGLNKDLEKKVITRTEQLESVNRELEAFSYSISHDLRAPLRGIIGFAAILEEDYSNKLDDEAKRVISVIKNNTMKMGRLIDDLLTFSRMGRQDIIKTKFPTASMIKEVVDELTLGKNDIKWIIHEIPDSKADINAMRQVWVNLISNAIKYSQNKKEPVIEIGSFTQNEHITFFVKDNGVGFDEKYKNKLFKVFQRLHSENDFEGTGIGLAIVEKIVSKHNGKVWAEAEINKGASFYFTLPT